MTDENKFNHDQNIYERPNHPYLCGRIAWWKAPCPQGPNLDGTCGGTRGCEAVFENDRWQCRREQKHGGPCDNGPGPNGECSIQKSPCAPRVTLRVIRGRLALLSIGFVLALVGFSQGEIPFTDRFTNFADPGPLSRPHTKFTQYDGCSSCHSAYGKGAGGWIKAVFSEPGMSDHCLSCHMFGGQGSKAHNNNTLKDSEVQKTECIMCHREHNGENQLIQTLSSKQCNFCHKVKFESFSRGHPEFSEKYPYFSRNTIKFDHSAHLNKHFSNPKVSEEAPKSCINCHMVSLADREVRPNTFEAICANCHESQIYKKELVLLRLPEFTKNLINRRSLVQACNFPKKSGGDEEEFLSISSDQAALVSAFLLNIPVDDPETYDQPLQNLIISMTEESTSPLAELIDSKTRDPWSKKLLAGLNPEVLKRVACSWGLNQEYEPPAEAEFGGWYADLLEVRYKPAGHRDPVAKSWAEFALAVSAIKDDEEQLERATVMRDQLLSPKEGVGGCIKCHAVSTAPSSGEDNHLIIEWGYEVASGRSHVRYSHPSHIDILGQQHSCRNCHILDSKADYMASFKSFDSSSWTGNFESIKSKTCTQCHAENQINQDCQMCHVYHFKPGFKKKMVIVQN